jgi:2-hydroxy-3-oxopropionate reductase
MTRSSDYVAEMQILMKDIDLAVAQGEELGVPMWVCEAARLVFKHAMPKRGSRGRPDRDRQIHRRRRAFQIPGDLMRVATR